MSDNLNANDLDPVANLKNAFRQALDILRKQHIHPDDYHVLLFLLLLQRDGYITELISSKPKDRDLYSIDFLSDFLYKIKRDERYSREIVNIFESIIAKFDSFEFTDLLSILNSLDQHVLAEHFPEIFDYLLYTVSKYHGRNSGEFLQPIELSRLISQMVDLPELAKIYNPFAGLASFSIFLDNDSSYVGQEINQTTWAIGSLRLQAYSREDKSSFILGDSIRNWNPYSDKYDLIVANPPFGLRVSHDIREQMGNVRTIEHFLIEKGIRDLKSDGKMIVVVPQGFLFRTGGEEELRRDLVERDLIDTIIVFPGGILAHTVIPISIIVINRNKSQKGIVRFVDAKRFIEITSKREKLIKDVELASILKNIIDSESVRFVPNKVIKGFEYNLDAQRHFAPTLSVVDGINVVRLKELVAVLRGQRNLGVQIGKFVRIRDLKGDSLQFQLSVNEIVSSEIPNASREISESCLLIATRWKSLKPTYFKYEGESIFVIPDTLALKVDETKVNVDFLINELYSDYFTEVVNSYRIGVAVPFIRKEDLLNTKIQLPSLEEQKAKVQGIRETLAKEKERELELFRKINGLESEITEQNTHLRHSLAGPASNLKGSFFNIKKILSEKVLINTPELMDFKVSQDHELTFGQYLEIIERDIEKITNAVSRRLKVETGIESKQLEKIEIVSFIRNYVNEYREKGDLNFEFKFEIDEDAFLDSAGELIDTYILANRELLTDLLNNLTDNAVAHAFHPDWDNIIEIYLMRDNEVGKVNEVQILFSNSGKSFPENIKFSDFIKKGSKAGLNSGEGYGGYYINEIIKYFKGDFDIIDEKGPEGLTSSDLATSFEINFPIIENGDYEKI